MSAFFFLIAAQEKESVNSYVGVATCGTCHKTEKQGKQLDIWKNSKHSQAYKTLQTEKANEVAKKLGHTTAAAETDACLKCHASGYEKDTPISGTKFDMKDGVQCETCHGPGSNYKNLKIMKDKQDSIKNGLIIHEKIEEFCKTCHNPESPTFVEMNFTESWEKIKHSVPKGN